MCILSVQENYIKNAMIENITMTPIIMLAFVDDGFFSIEIKFTQSPYIDNILHVVTRFILSILTNPKQPTILIDCHKG